MKETRVSPRGGFVARLAGVVHSIASVAAWTASSFAVVFAVMVAILNSVTNPVDLDTFAPWLIMVLGGIILTALLCGGFRRKA
jgi:hypothetical protein